MIITTRDFGEIEISEKDVITFVDKIFGFEEYTSYVMLFDDEVGTSFGWLQSVDEPEICFLVANPGILSCEYKPSIPQSVKKGLEGDVSEIWLVMTAGGSLENSTVNMKSPIVINNANGFASQIIVEEDYEIRHRVFGKEIA